MAAGTSAVAGGASALGNLFTALLQAKTAREQGAAQRAFSREQDERARRLALLRDAQAQQQQAIQQQIGASQAGTQNQQQALANLQNVFARSFL